eukprot:CAMPEP_0198655458 /NCGR_PEP_ID=MMETSP1467-20131203/8371_1 /TAXON_ID=1462469 /ORGANISM="unid. sp., Strain CCMP2135" /LENGTH=205 /DNA_ID=CAMNT_0044391465 /DNA_START=44 /DNA_END=661 /DNA_ORIENTATION=+
MAAAYSRVETEEEACEAKEEEAALVSKSYQTVQGEWASLTPNQLSQLAEWEELNSFRDGVFRCDNNLWPSCVCSFCCPCVHLGQLAQRLGVAPAWLVPAVLFSLLLLAYVVDVAATEALYLAAWTLAIWVVRLKVRRYFRPNPGPLGDFSQLPGHVDDCCLALWCGPCAIAQLSRHVGNYKLHGSTCFRTAGAMAQDFDNGDSLI